MAEDSSAAWPIADETLSQSLLDLVQQAGHIRQLKKGANETTKTLNRYGIHLTRDINYHYLDANFCHLDKNVPYVYVPSKMALGRATGVSRPVIACSITTNEASDLNAQIRTIRNQVERLMI
ncbi:hypothetical protein N7509_007977 [Penicillium cosmopolitanum]|uniref:H/ACA ribonucleoprotein complex subunit 2 n=1 Tax=Penicillium cosmopolitanum TaxID=1131564 RepID=A0A9W9VZU0_9EURO|nr:uncharacterized protein N7509_007977 [Penicillium cosmopolitanum]KAJ5392487.1 hypothetical protein N7509_007977 [Penicillium cosmopolitanum]